MFNTWLALKQTTEALSQGRLDDAFQLAAQPAVRGHQRGGELGKQLSLAFLERAKRRLAAAEVQGAWRDIRHAAEMGAEPRLIEKFRDQAAEAAATQLRACLNQGPAQAALDRIADFKKQDLALPQLQQL